MVNNLAWTPEADTRPTRRTRRAAAPATNGVPVRDGEVALGLLPGLLGYRLRRAQTAVFDSFAGVVGAEEDITPGLFGMLQVIAANPGLCQSRLAEAMHVDRSTIVTVVHRLAERGLVVRDASPDDGRSHALRLTPAGRRAIRRMEALVRRHEEEIAHALSPGERRTLMSLLERLYARGRGEEER